MADGRGKGPLDFVLLAIRLKAMGIPTSSNGQSFPAVNFEELGRRLKENGSLTKMVKCASANYVSILEVWQSAPEAIAVLQEMRKEASENARD